MKTTLRSRSMGNEPMARGRRRKSLTVEMRAKTRGRVLRQAEVGDVDDFGRILLTTVMGTDETRGWFASKGGVF